MATMKFFASIDELRQVVPGLEASLNDYELVPAYNRAVLKLKKVLTTTVFAQLETAWDNSQLTEPETTPTDEEKAAIAFLTPALGNLMTYHDFIFKVTRKKKEDVNYYKYELLQLRETYLDNYAIYMDSLLDYLDEKAPITAEGETSKFPGWTDSTSYKMRQSLLLKNADAFNLVLPTGGSAYFFQMIAPLQKQVIDTELLSRYKLADIPETIAETVNRFVAYRTMYKALRLCDYADLPQSMRQKLFVDDAKNKAPEAETIAERYANQFNAEADKFLRLIDLKIQEPADDVTEVANPADDFNLESDQSFVIC